MNETKWKVDFWDTAGQERFDRLHPSYYFGAHSCMLVFDVTRKITYSNLYGKILPLTITFQGKMVFGAAPVLSLHPSGLLS